METLIANLVLAEASVARNLGYTFIGKDRPWGGLEPWMLCRLVGQYGQPSTENSHIFTMALGTQYVEVNRLDKTVRIY